MYITRTALIYLVTSATNLFPRRFPVWIQKYSALRPVLTRKLVKKTPRGPLCTSCVRVRYCSYLCSFASTFQLRIFALFIWVLEIIPPSISDFLAIMNQSEVVTFR